MRWRLLIAFAAFAVLSLFIAACGNDDSSGNGQAGDDDNAAVTDPDEENDLAETLLLTANDFPAGWSEMPSTGTGEESPLDELCETPDTAPGRTGTADTGDFAGTGFAEASQSLALFVDEDAADAMLDASRELVECFAAAFNDGHMDEDGAAFSDARVSTVSFPSLGDASDAYRLTITITIEDEGAEADFHMDFVILRVGRVATLIAAMDIITPFDSDLLADIATNAAGRIEAANVPPYGAESSDD